ncbi:hypothetical protein [Bacteroides acidifaciens]|uniref:hypothetical protein n=1 Tax=Bacteroides acidifaciens TaxID=85831 RepID=UPI00263A6182|nr:hypothetical protein [Bacteroides acidifaciens]
MKKVKYTENGKQVTELQFNKMESYAGCGALGIIGALAVYGVAVTGSYIANALEGGKSSNDQC